MLLFYPIQHGLRLMINVVMLILDLTRRYGGRLPPACRGIYFMAQSALAGKGLCLVYHMKAPSTPHNPRLYSTPQSPTHSLFIKNGRQLRNCLAYAEGLR